jgi:hypothetical protein
MCNLYTLRLSAWEVRNLMQHYTLIGKEWEETIGARNDALEVFPNYEAPVVILRGGSLRPCAGAFLRRRRRAARRR